MSRKSPLTSHEEYVVRQALPAFRTAWRLFQNPHKNGGGTGKFKGETADEILARHGITLEKRYGLVVEELCRRGRGARSPTP